MCFYDGPQKIKKNETSNKKTQNKKQGKTSKIK